MVDADGAWPEGLLDAHIAMIPKADGDATPLRPLCVLPVFLGFGPYAWMIKSQGPDSVLRPGGGRSSVEAWFSTAIDIEECLAAGIDSEVHLFVADVVKSFDTVDWGILDRVPSSLGLPGWMRTLDIMHGCGCVSSLLWVWGSLGLEMKVSEKGAR